MPTWARNETVAARRRCDLELRDSSGVRAPRGTDFTGYVYVSQSTSTYVAAAGTLTNKRRPLVVADDDFTATHGTETLTATGHGLETGDGPIRLTNSGGALPAGLATATDYWVIRVDANDFQLASSLANAYAGTEVTFSDNGTGTHTLVDTASTQRGIDGDFIFEATQAETNFDGAEFTVAILGHATYEGATRVALSSSADDFGGGVLEGAITRDDAARIVLRTLAAKFSKVGNDYVWRDMADSKDSHHGTVTTAGRIDADIDDPT